MASQRSGRVYRHGMDNRAEVREFLIPRRAKLTPQQAGLPNVGNRRVPGLRTEAGRDPYDRGLYDLVGELSTRSEDFRRRWSAHNVRYHGAGTKHFHHQVVGNLELAYESVDMISEAGLTMTIYAAEPGSPTEHALALLASWTATQDVDIPRGSHQ